MKHIRGIYRSSARQRLSHGTDEPPASQPGGQRADLLATLLGLLDEAVKSLREATAVAENAGAVPCHVLCLQAAPSGLDRRRAPADRQKASSCRDRAQAIAGRLGEPGC